LNYPAGMIVYFCCNKNNEGFFLKYQFSCFSKKEMEALIGSKNDYLIVDFQDKEKKCLIQSATTEEEFSVQTNGSVKITWFNDFGGKREYSSEQLSQSLDELKTAS
jgi:hypothetical protein